VYRVTLPDGINAFLPKIVKPADPLVFRDFLNNSMRNKIHSKI